MKHMKRSRILCPPAGPITRREFALRAGLGMTGIALTRDRVLAQNESPSSLALARNSDRRSALREAVGLLGNINFGGKDLYLKANFTSADPFPATTHPDTLREVVGLLRERNCGKLVLVERSSMGSTRHVWEMLEIPALARELDIQLLALDDLAADQWRKELLPESNWKAGVEVPKFLDRECCLIQICNLKTHRFGAMFSASLKNSVGLVAKYGLLNAGYNYMKELHDSPHQSAMIADLNLVYEPKLILMDATKVFINGGPEAGELAAPEVVLASADRAAIDAIGVALLRLHGTGPEQPLAWRTVYEQEQLKRAVELKLGAASSREIRFLTTNIHSQRLTSQIEAILQEVPKKPGDRLLPKFVGNKRAHST
jgi:uncharacterized protein (DUF362 family)